MERAQPLVNAAAEIRGGNGYPDLRGTATFLTTDLGILVTLKVDGLPKEEVCNGGIFALHIHEGESCTGNGGDTFSNAGTHYNPSNCPHPYHAGDLPPLIGNDGFAYMTILTNRFTINDILGRVIVIHEGKDDFSTQPAGNAGAKIGCGEIVRA